MKAVFILMREIKMMEIVRMLNDDMALRNIYDADPLRHNDDEYRHPIVILVKVVNDAAPCYASPFCTAIFYYYV